MHSDLIDQLRNRLDGIITEEDDDQYLTKFFIARDKNLDAAEKMVKKAKAIIKALQAEDLSDYECPEAFRNHIGGILCGHDKQFRPVWYDKIMSVDWKGISKSISLTDIIKCKIRFLRGVVAKMKEDSIKYGRDIQQIVLVSDLSGLSMEFIRGPGCTIIMALEEIFTTLFPETLFKSVCVNVPPIFTVFYKIAVKLMDPTVLSKVSVIRGPGINELLELIDEDQLLDKFGGKLKISEDDCKISFSCADWGVPVPTSLYVNPMDSPVKLNVPARSKRSVPIEITSGDKCNLRIYIFAANSSIWFGLESVSGEEILPRHKHQFFETYYRISICLDFSLDKYNLVFDNSDSFLTSRTVLYKYETI